MAGQSAVELKGGMYTLLSLQILSAELDAVSEALKSKVQQAPGFFKDTPIVLDVSPIEENETVDTARLLDIITEHHLIAIAARVLDPNSTVAEAISLPVLDTGQSQPSNKKTEYEISGEQSDEEQAGDILEEEDVDNVEGDSVHLESHKILEMPASGPTIITRPVRSGQQVYAQGGELVVLAQAGAGAELISDSNIHVYGPLRGRALCGVTGNTNARIFCRSLEAELVSVAGNFKPLEEIPADLKGQPAQIWWDGNKLRIEAMN